MKLQEWLILSALVVAAHAQAAEEPVAKTAEAAKVCMQKAEER